MLGLPTMYYALVQGDNANGSVLKVHFSIDALTAGRIDHLVFFQFDP